MSDPDTNNSAPVDTFGSDPEGLQSAIDDFRTKRTIAEVSSSYDPSVDEQEEPEAPRVTDGNEGPLTVRQEQQ